MPNDHREKAVEAGWAGNVAGIGLTLNEFDAALTAAEPHLQRMFFERFRETMLSDAAIDAGVRAAGLVLPTPRPRVGATRIHIRPAIEAALDTLEDSDG